MILSPCCSILKKNNNRVFWCCVLCVSFKRGWCLCIIQRLLIVIMKIHNHNCSGYYVLETQIIRSGFCCFITTLYLIVERTCYMHHPGKNCHQFCPYELLNVDLFWTVVLSLSLFWWSWVSDWGTDRFCRVICEWWPTLIDLPPGDCLKYSYTH